jgi:hemoglobin
MSGSAGNGKHVSNETFFARVGGAEAVHSLAERFYGRVLSDDLLLPLFRDPTENHAERMAWWLIEVFGGPPLHTRRRGGFSAAVVAHHGLQISEAQRLRWLSHMHAAAAEMDMDPDLFRDYAKYLETASRFAMHGSR